MLTLGNQTLVDRTGEQGDAVLADLVAEVLTGEADRTRVRGTQDVHIQVLPVFCMGRWARSGHGFNLSTSVLSAACCGVKWRWVEPSLGVVHTLQPDGKGTR